MKKLKYSLLSLLAVLGMASCSNDYEYTVAEKLSNAQVYFPSTLATSYEVTMDDSVFNLQVSRANTSGELTVNFDLQGDSLLELPKSVTFADGEATVDVTAKALVSEMGYDNPQVFTMTIDSLQTTPYGTSAYVATVSAPAPWKSLGMCTFTEDGLGPLYGAKCLTYKVELQENMLQPGFYRLVNPYGAAYPYNEEGDYDASQDYYLYIHAEDPDFVYIPLQSMGVDWGDGEFAIMDFAYYYMMKGNAAEDVKAAGYGGKLKEGEITFPAKGMLCALGENGYYYANSSGSFSVLFPGVVKADYSAEVAYTGLFTGADGTTSACGTLTLGADAKDVRAIVMPQDVDASAVADAIAAGELEAQAVSAGTIMVPFDAAELDASKLQVIVVVLNGAEVKNIVTTNFEYFGGGANPWKSLGIGSYTDDILMPMFSMDEEGTPFEPQTYEVEVLENKDEPGLYRIVDPYAVGVHPYAEALVNGGITMPAKGTCYLEINAVDAEGVYIATQDLGVKWPESIGFMSEAYRFMEKYEVDVLKQYGYFGAIRDGVIKFPAFYIDSEDESKGYYQGVITEDGNLAYYGGTNASITVTLPSAYKASPRKVASKYIAECLNRTDWTKVGVSFKNVPSLTRQVRKIGFKNAQKFLMK